MKNKIIGIVLSFALIAAMLPAMSMPAYATGQGQESVAYLDKDDNTQYCTNYTVVDSTTTFEEPGWYVVKANEHVTFDNKIEVDYTNKESKDLHLILCDNTTLTFEKGLRVKIAASSASAGSVNIYAQSTGDDMGALTASNDPGDQMSIHAISASGKESIIINGGCVNATTNNGVAIYASDKLEINGGDIKAQGDRHGIVGNIVGVTINDGKIRAKAKDGVNNSYGIYTSKGVVINGGDITTTGPTAGIHGGEGVDITNGTVTTISTAEGLQKYGIHSSEDITIEGGEITASGELQALYGTVKNSIPGAGWANTDGSGTKTAIKVNANPGQTLDSFKRVEFPVEPEPEPGPDPTPAVNPVSAEVADYSLPKVANYKPIRGKAKIKASWKKLSKKNRKKVDGIEVQISPSKAFADGQTVTVNVKKTNRTKNFKKLARKTTYYTRVRTYKYVDGVKHVSKWSKIKKNKTR